MFGCGNGIAERCVHYGNIRFSGCRNVNIVQADPGSADHFKIFCLGQKIFINTSFAADGQAIVDADDLFKFSRGKVGFDINIKTRGVFENIDTDV